MGFYQHAKEEILPRLVARFNLMDRPDSPGNELILPRYIQPVTDIDELLRTPKIKSSGNVAYSATGVKVAHTVPTGKRWMILAHNLNRIDGDGTVTSIGVGDGTVNIAFDSFSATASKITVLAQPIPAEEGWTVYFNINAMTQAGNFNLSLLISEEDAF